MKFRCKSDQLLHVVVVFRSCDDTLGAVDLADSRTSVYIAIDPYDLLFRGETAHDFQRFGLRVPALANLA